MAENMADIRLSRKASDMAEYLKDIGWFSYAKDAAIFAAAYVVKNYKDFKPEEYMPKDKDGSNYAYGSLDNDGTWDKLITVLYETNSPRLCLRNLMIYGLELMGEDREKNVVIRLDEYI